MTQAIPPDTIFDTLTVCTGLCGSLTRVRRATSSSAHAERSGNCTLLAAARGSGKPPRFGSLASCRLASDPPPFSLSLALFCRSSVRQRPELHGMHARRLFAVKCIGQCIFVVARYTLAMRAQPPGQGRAFAGPGRGDLALSPGTRRSMREARERPRLSRDFRDFNVVSL